MLRCSAIQLPSSSLNAFEDNASIESIQHAKESFFETETGKHILDTMFKS